MKLSPLSEVLQTVEDAKCFSAALETTLNMPTSLPTSEDELRCEKEKFFSEVFFHWGN